MSSAVLTRPLPRNEALEGTLNPRLAAGFDDVADQAFGAPTLGGLARRGLEIGVAEARAGVMGRRTDPATLNERYQDLGLTFDRPMTDEGAEIIASARRAEMIRDDTFARGPGGVAGTAVTLGAGLAAVATDPLEVAASFIPIVGPARSAALVGRFGAIGGRTAVGAIEGAAGAALTAPIEAMLSHSQGLDYTLNDALANTVLGGFLGAGLGAGAGVLSRLRERPGAQAATAERTSGLPPDQDIAAGQLAFRQALTSEPIDVTPALSARSAVSPAVTSARMPIVQAIVQRGGVAAESVDANDLRALGVDSPGLVRRQGASRGLDRVAPDEVAPELAERIGLDDTGQFLNRDRLVQAIAEEMQAEPQIGARAGSGGGSGPRPSRSEALQEGRIAVRQARSAGALRQVPDTPGAREWLAREALEISGGARPSRSDVGEAAARWIQEEARAPNADVSPGDLRGDGLPSRQSEQSGVRAETPLGPEDPPTRSIDSSLGDPVDTWLDEDDVVLGARLDELRRTGAVSKEGDGLIDEATMAEAEAAATGDVMRAYAACIAQ
ncbi:MAG: hypothetical protein AAFR47_02280 [Pseudomonadota bacterium]